MGRECHWCRNDISDSHPDRLYCTEVFRSKARSQRANARRASIAANSHLSKKCGICGKSISHMGRQARFCSKDCQKFHTRTVARHRRLEENPTVIHHCQWCHETFEGKLKSKPLYCSNICKKYAERKRWSAKIALYRSEDPARYQKHRDRENMKRIEQRNALKLVTEIMNKGLEALL